MDTRSTKKTASTAVAAEPLSDGYRLVTVMDQWAELLPPRVPLRFSFFRYLGFCVKHTVNGKSTIVKGRQIGGLRVVMQNEGREIFNDKVSNCFKNGVYYVQDVHLDQAGHHKITVQVEGPLASSVEPLVLETQVYEFMQLEECDDLHTGPYASMREFVQSCRKRGVEDKLRDDAFVESFVRSKSHKLRVIDAKCAHSDCDFLYLDVQWWLNAYVKHAMDREVRQKELQKKAVVRVCVTAGVINVHSIDAAAHLRNTLDERTISARTTIQVSCRVMPINVANALTLCESLYTAGRTGDQREHDNLFERRRREWKKMRSGELRMFTNEPLHAGATITTFSRREMYRQLSLYAQV
ncbi:TPA: hypothetical protein N0F65_002404 [Lagenidium giganteum]|uniref:Uncharacterized protein n=1 Tax=Lagenidium giganteum TaxID=4803 RepID=A0AAV2YMU4_9STRA|nr:TPA: hypothetical protein N0F65_002404 [Lagenidium giganteum]